MNRLRIITSKNLFLPFMFGIIVAVMFWSVSLADAENKLIAHWQFDEGSGTTVSDSEGNVPDGTIYGATWKSDDLPPPYTTGSVLEFPGIGTDKATAGGYIVVPDDPGFDLGTAFTLEAWIKCTGNNEAGTSQMIFDKQRDGSHRYFVELYLGDNYLWGSFENPDNVFYGIKDPNIQVMDNQWHHVAFVYDGTYVKTFVDGRLDVSKTITNQDDDGCPSWKSFGYPQWDVNVPIANNDQSLYIGAIGYYTYPSHTPPQTFKGLMDEVRLYNYSANRSGTVTLVDQSPALTWNYALTADAGAAVTHWSYTGTGITDATVDGDAAASGWGVQSQTSTQVIFCSATPLISGSLTGFHITGTTVGKGEWHCCDNSRSVEGPTRAYGDDYVKVWDSGITIPNPVFDVAVGDTDGDGKPEIIVSDVPASGGAKIYVFENTGDNSYQLTWNSGTMLTMRKCHVSIGDQDRDGKSEIIALENHETLHVGKLHVFENNGDNAYQEVWNSGSALDNLAVGELFLGDADSDGKREIIFTTGIYSGHHEIRIYENTGDNAYQEVWNSGNTLSDAIQEGAVGDTDGDGKKEIIVGSGDLDSKVHVFECNGDDSYDIVPWDSGGKFSWQVWANIGDQDGDGKAEIIAGGEDRVVHIFENTGDNTYTDVWNSGTMDTRVDLVATGDGDHDGRREIIVPGYTDSQTEGKVYLFENTGDNAYQEVWNSGSIMSGSAYRVAVGDQDEDGKGEIIVPCYDGKVYVFESVSMCPKVGDVSGDGSISPFDATLILQYVVGLLDSFPVDMLTSPDGTSSRDYVLSLPELTASAGDRIQAPILINDAMGLVAGGISLKYDPTILKAIDVAAYGILSKAYWQGNTNLEGEVRFAFSATKGAIGSGRMLVVEFEVLPDAEGKRSSLILDNVNFSGSLTITKIDGSVTVLPIKTALLPNFPNPFNPETWIPYKLAQPAPVVIRIYNQKGQIVRTLSLGKKNAGLYLTKDNVAYWDGKDSLGQQVASGVYFYTLQAEDFKTTRKMVLMK